MMLMDPVVLPPATIFCPSGTMDQRRLTMVPEGPKDGSRWCSRHAAEPPDSGSISTCALEGRENALFTRTAAPSAAGDAGLSHPPDGFHGARGGLCGFANRLPGWSGDGPGPLPLRKESCGAQAEVVVPVAGIVRVAVSGTAVPCRVVVPAAAIHPMRALRTVPSPT